MVNNVFALRQRSADPVAGASLSPEQLGERLRSLRAERGWSLEEASRQVGLSRSALSKIERNEMSPTFSALHKIASGFRLELTGLLNPGGAHHPTGRRSIHRAGEGPIRKLPHYDLRLLLSDLKQTAFIPYETVARARSIGEFKEWDRHPSEDFVYVLSGQVCLHTEFYEPVLLDTGDSVFFDARMGHAFLAAGEAEARMLCISAMQD